MGDDRLLTYAMAAFGLDADAEAPATVRAMLEGGVTDPDSPANTSTNKGYAAFVAAFDFAQYGDQATARDAVQQAVPKAVMAGTGLVLVKPTAQYIKGEADYYAANISKVKSIEDLLKDKRLLTFAMAAYGLDASTQTAEADPHDGQRRRHRSVQPRQPVDRQELRQLRHAPSISPNMAIRRPRATRC